MDLKWGIEASQSIFLGADFSANQSRKGRKNSETGTGVPGKDWDSLISVTHWP
jgi:hypothetical protein